MKWNRNVCCMPSAIFSVASVFILTLVMIISIDNQVSAQKQQPANKETGKLNFFEIQKQFYDSWKDRTITKGSGYKPFRRWEWFWEQRVGREGIFPSNDVVVREWEKYSEANASDITLDSAANWTPMGPFTTKSGYAGLGRINCIAFHPSNPNTFWVGTPSGGLWKTINYGQTWTNDFDNKPVLGVSDIVIDPNNPMIMYIATGDGDGGSLSAMTGSGEGDTKSIGILKSVNGGTSWNQTGLSWNVTSAGLIRRLIMDPNDSRVLYAATSFGIYQTTDAGNNWTKQIDGYFTDILFNTGNPEMLYAASKSDESNSGQIFRTIDQGENWEQVSAFAGVERIKLSVTPQNDELVEAIGTNPKGGLQGLYRSTDSGETFIKFLTVTANCSNNMLNAYPDPENHSESCGGQGGYDLFYLINPNNLKERWLGGVNTWKSSDEGKTWNLVNYWTDDLPQYPTVHADKHWFAFHPLQSGTFMEANDGGIYYTKNGGTSWNDITIGMQIGQIYRIGNSYTNPEIVIGGFQDNGSQVDSAGSWLAPPVIGGDGMDCLIDYVNPAIKYSSYADGLISRTINTNWTNVVEISANIPGKPKGSWVTPYIIHPKNPEILFAGYTNIYKTTNRGNTWQQVSNLPEPDPDSDTLLRSLEISQSDPQVMVAATQFSLYRTTDGWKTQTSIDSELPVDSCTITQIAIHPKNPDTLFVTFSGYKAGKKVYRSNDGGKHWINISGSLPNIPVNCIKFQDSANEALYIGTDIGVWFINNSMTDWKYFSKGLPNVVITDLEIQYMAGKIRASTYGRGLWESDLYIEPGTYQINAVDIPVTGGDVEGDGVFLPGETATMIAKPETGWDFKGWYEKEVLVSDTETYVFAVNSNRNLVGKFSSQTGIEDKGKEKIHLFPNPTTGIVEVRLEKQILGDLQNVIVMNMEAKPVYKSDASGWGDNFFIDLSDNPSGTYLITFYFRSGSKVSYNLLIRK